jgi:hypothetical protein
MPRCSGHVDEHGGELDYAEPSHVNHGVFSTATSYNSDREKALENRRMNIVPKHAYNSVNTGPYVLDTKGNYMYMVDDKGHKEYMMWTKRKHMDALRGRVLWHHSSGLKDAIKYAFHTTEEKERFVRENFVIKA